MEAAFFTGMEKRNIDAQLYICKDNSDKYNACFLTSISLTQFLLGLGTKPISKACVVIPTTHVQQIEISIPSVWCFPQSY